MFVEQTSTERQKGRWDVGKLTEDPSPDRTKSSINMIK